MPIYNIRGINVDFPYDAYDSQITYMDKVIEALQGKSNALLESPTGTGKTLCLLCATLAYRASLGSFSTGKPVSDVSSSQGGGSFLPKIVYTSRTHSQLRQVVRELKKTNYRPKMIIIGSREQLCIHEKVKLLHGRAQTHACQQLRRRQGKRYCQHYMLAADFVKGNPRLGDEPVDIEDLVNIGKSCGPCPYYVSRELIKVVDILFAPYNYLIDRSYKDRLGIEWSSSILIFDEAHNLESICADAASFDLPSSLLSACISEAKNCIDLSIRRRDIDKSADKSYNPDSFAILRALLLKLEKRIADVPIESKELGFTRPGPYIYELLAELNVTSDTASMLTETIEQAVLLLEEEGNRIDCKASNGTSCRLESIGEMLKIIFQDGGSSHAKYYRVHVQERVASEFDAYRGGSSKARTLSWWCFNPGICMEDFSRRGVGSVILTSGTLCPLDSFAYEFKLEFPVRLENPHVISSDQIWAGVVSEGPSGCLFNSSYRNRDVLEYKQELGNAIVNFARIVPDGLLVFFPSYYVMEICISCWKENSHKNFASQQTIWERICKFKQPVIEPRQSSLFPASIEDFRSKLNNPSTSGAVFFAVCRGKVSEGLDFADQYGRAVIITGLPFATRTDPKVRLKREYLDESLRNNTTGHKPLTGEQWYDQQASRAVNQAVGRVIRHRHDYGAIILCDERFASSYRQSQVSRWIQPHIKCYPKFGDVVYSLTRFFRVGVPLLPKLEPQAPAPNAVDSVKLEPLEAASNDLRPIKDEPLDTASNGKGCKEKATRPLGACRSGKILNTSASDDDCCILSSSVNVHVGQADTFSLFGDIVPANKSSLSLQKQKSAVPVKLEPKQKLPAAGIGYEHEKLKINDLTDDFSNDRISDKNLLVRCTSKRQKTIKTEPCSTAKSGITEAQSECSPSMCGSSGKEICRKNMIENTSSFLEASGDTTVSGRKFIHGKQSNLPESSPEEKANGLDFLSQVKEVLNKPEYDAFRGYLKALQSKKMTIGPVLKSVVTLFSAPDRNPLLKSVGQPRYRNDVDKIQHYVDCRYLSACEDLNTTSLRRTIIYMKNVVHQLMEHLTYNVVILKEHGDRSVTPCVYSTMSAGHCHRSVIARGNVRISKA